LESGYKSCLYCAELIREGAVICRFCNRRVVQETAARAQTSAAEFKAEPILKPGSPRRRNWLPILVFLLFIGVLVAVIVVLWKDQLSARPGTHQAAAPAAEVAPTDGSETALRAASSSPPPPRELSTGEIFAQASPSVVLIEVFDDEGHKRAFGSGFLVSSGGSVVTNYHVIRGAYSALVHFQDGASAPVLGVVGYDPSGDVAVVAVASTNGRPPLKIGNPSLLSVGDKVVAIGSPEGLQNTTSEGIVTALRGPVIQMSTPISHGSSGGPVLSAHGDVVGIAVATVAAGENLNFAVPISWAASYIDGTPSKSLTEVAQENTVTENLLDGQVAILAHGNRAWNIRLDPNRMSNAEIHGDFQSTGGLDGLIRVDVVCNPGGMVYDSGRVRFGQLHVDLRGEGACRLVVDNSVSPMFGHNVTGTIALRYVK
jgi:S1-C subfamily serine protease